MNATPSVALLAVGDKGLSLFGDLRAHTDIRTVVTYSSKGYFGPEVDDFRRRCERTGSELLQTTRPDAAVSAGADLVFAVGWQYLIDDPPLNLIVLHDSLLPRHRGLAPTVSALIAGDRSLGVPAIRPVGEFDAGPILAQRSPDVEPPVRIATAFELLRSCYADVALQVLDRWRDRDLTGRGPDETHATYSIWRDAADLWIDWRWPADRIARFVHAVGHPYGGARTDIDGQEVIADDVRPVVDLRFVERHVGKVRRLDEDGPVVVCGEGWLCLTAMRSTDGSDYHIDRLRTRMRPRHDRSSGDVDV